MTDYSNLTTGLDFSALEGFFGPEDMESMLTAVDGATLEGEPIAVTQELAERIHTSILPMKEQAERIQREANIFIEWLLEQGHVKGDDRLLEFRGNDASGKTTNARTIATELRVQGEDAIFLRGSGTTDMELYLGWLDEQFSDSPKYGTAKRYLERLKETLEIYRALEDCNEDEFQNLLDRLFDVSPNLKNLAPLFEKERHSLRMLTAGNFQAIMFDSINWALDEGLFVVSDRGIYSAIYGFLAQYGETADDLKRIFGFIIGAMDSDQISIGKSMVFTGPPHVSIERMLRAGEDIETQDSLPRHCGEQVLRADNFRELVFDPENVGSMLPIDHARTIEKVGASVRAGVKTLFDIGL